jgi:hypothetical protein
MDPITITAAALAAGAWLKVALYALELVSRAIDFEHQVDDRRARRRRLGTHRRAGG